MRKFATRYRRPPRPRWTRGSGEPRPLRRWALPLMLWDMLIDGGAALRTAARRLGLDHGDGDLLCFLLAVSLVASYGLTALGASGGAELLVLGGGALGGLVLAKCDRERLWLRWRLRHAGAGPFVARCLSVWGVGDWGVYDRRKPALFTTAPDADGARLQARRLNMALELAMEERAGAEVGTGGHGLYDADAVTRHPAEGI